MSDATPGMSPVPAAKKKGLPWWGWLIVVVVGLMVLGQLGGDEETAAPSGEASTTEAAVADEPVAPKPAPVKPVTVSAYDLMAAYKANGVAADEKYKGKTLIIEGTVESIDKDIMDTPYVALRGSSDEYSMESVQCMFEEDASKLGSLKKGQKVRIQGQVDGYMMNVLVRESTLL